MVEVDHNASLLASVLNQTKLLTTYVHTRCLILKSQFLKSFCFSHYKPLHVLIAYKTNIYCNLNVYLLKEGTVTIIDGIKDSTVYIL